MLLYLYLNDIFQGIITVTIAFGILFATFLIFLPMWADPCRYGSLRHNQELPV